MSAKGLIHDRNSLSPVGICQVQLLHTPLDASLLLDGSVLESTGEGEGPMQLKAKEEKEKKGIDLYASSCPQDNISYRQADRTETEFRAEL